MLMDAVYRSFYVSFSLKKEVDKPSAGQKSVRSVSLQYQVLLRKRTFLCLFIEDNLNAMFEELK